MKMRILVFEDSFSVRKPLCLFLRRKGHEVLDFPSPVTCELVVSKTCTCPLNHACADLVITDMIMPEMSGLDLVRVLAEKGCKAPSQNKIVISSVLTPEQEAEFRSLGCNYLRKPFELNTLEELLQTCEKNLSPTRKLIPLEELRKTCCKLH